MHESDSIHFHIDTKYSSSTNCRYVFYHIHGFCMESYHQNMQFYLWYAEWTFPWYSL